MELIDEYRNKAVEAVTEISAASNGISERIPNLIEAIREDDYDMLLFASTEVSALWQEIRESERKILEFLTALELYPKYFPEE